MHEMAVFWLRVATALYGVGLLHVMAVLLRRKAGFLKPALFAFLVGAVLHFVAIVEMTIAIGHLPVDNFFESATVCAFLIAVLFLFVYWRYDAASLSVCIFPLVFVMTQVGAMETPIAAWPSTNVRALAAAARHDGSARLRGAAAHRGGIRVLPDPGTPAQAEEVARPVSSACRRSARWTT